LQQRVVTQRWIGLGIASTGALALGGLGMLLVRRTRLARAERARRREVEAALAQADARLAQAFANNADAMLVTARPGGIVLDVNAALCRLVGASADELVGKSLDSLPSLANMDNLRDLRAMIDRDGHVDGMPLRVLRADGQLRSCLISGELMRAGTE
jgi:PAS domain S-box-containing protein